MKLFELIQPKKKSVQVSKQFDPLAPRSTRSIMAQDQGSFAFVQDAKDPFLIHRISKSISTPKIKDGYTDYINEVIERDLANQNPHFPRLYKVNRTQDDKGRFVENYTMEKLIKQDQITSPTSDENNKYDYDQTLNTATQSGEEEGSELYRQNIKQHKQFMMTQGRGRHVSDEPMVNEPMHNFVNVIEYACHTGDLSVLKDNETLKEAITILRDIQKKYKLEWDIHDKNILYRRGKTGLVPVFTDPFA